MLPWESTVPHRLTPVKTETLILEHLKQALQHQGSLDLSAENPKQLVLTVPASFDEVAKRLTLKAAKQAGFEDDVVLLEEPLAAMYSWLSQRQEHWRDSLTPGDIVFVCDVGGGTTDFSLILVGEDEGNLTLDRMAVGEHILWVATTWIWRWPTTSKNA